MQFAASSFQCDSPSGMSNFDAASYMGIWYEQVHVTGEPFQPDSWTCNTAQYSGLTDAGEFKVSNTGESAHQRFNKRFGVSGSGNCPTPGLAECYVSFFGQSTDYPNYVVLETDYDSYSVINTCEESQQKAYLWFMGREPKVSDDLYSKMMGIAQSHLTYFDYSTLAEPDVQGDMCTYPKPIVELDSLILTLQ